MSSVICTELGASMTGCPYLWWFYLDFPQTLWGNRNSRYSKIKWIKTWYFLLNMKDRFNRGFHLKNIQIIHSQTDSLSNLWNEIAVFLFWPLGYRLEIYFGPFLLSNGNSQNMLEEIHFKLLALRTVFVGSFSLVSSSNLAQQKILLMAIEYEK